MEHHNTVHWISTGTGTAGGAPSPGAPGSFSWLPTGIWNPVAVLGTYGELERWRPSVRSGPETRYLADVRHVY